MCYGCAALRSAVPWRMREGFWRAAAIADLWPKGPPGELPIFAVGKLWLGHSFLVHKLLGPRPPLCFSYFPEADAETGEGGKWHMFLDRWGTRGSSRGMTPAQCAYRRRTCQGPRPHRLPRCRGRYAPAAPQQSSSPSMLVLSSSLMMHRPRLLMQPRFRGARVGRSPIIRMSVSCSQTCSLVQPPAPPLPSPRGLLFEWMCW